MLIFFRPFFSLSDFSLSLFQHGWALKHRHETAVLCSHRPLPTSQRETQMFFLLILWLSERSMAFLPIFPNFFFAFRWVPNLTGKKKKRIFNLAAAAKVKEAHFYFFSSDISDRFTRFMGSSKWHQWDYQPAENANSKKIPIETGLKKRNICLP